MTFFSPIFLWFLPLVTLPVIIHLLAKRRSKLIDFPSLKFLKLLEQDSLRKFNIKQLILLIIRTLMILMIILAFARPNWNYRNGFHLFSQHVDLMIFALDNTASNRANFTALTEPWLVDLGTELAAKGTQVLYLGVTDFTIQNTPNIIQSEYRDLYSGDVSKRLAEQIDLERYRVRSIVWLGDGQDAQEILGDLDNWEKYILLASVTNDRAVTSVELPRRGLRKGEEYQLEIGVTQASDDEEITGLELLINERRQNQAVIEAGVGFIEMSAKVKDAGFQEGRLELSQDEQNYNDIRYFVIPAAGNTMVQILRTRRSLDYWSIMTSSIIETGQNVDILLLDTEEIDNLNLSHGGTVIIEDASLLADYNWNRLKGFVAAGGQLILFGNGGDRMTELLHFTGPLKAEQSSSSLGLYLTNEAKNGLDISPIEDLIAQDRLKVFNRFTVSANELDQTWIRYLDDQPFLGAADWQSGRTIWFNTEFKLEANNLPLLGVFPALILQLCQSQKLVDQTSRFNAVVGDTIHFIPTAQEGKSLTFSIQRPDGTIDYQAPDSSYMIHYSNTNLPGIYRLGSGRQVLQPVAVNISTYEAQAHDNPYSFDDPTIYVNDKKDDLTVEILNRGSGIALWPLLLSLLLFLWVAETYLSRIKSSWRQNV